jgi:hypothetical protein
MLHTSNKICYDTFETIYFLAISGLVKLGFNQIAEAPTAIASARVSLDRLFLSQAS